MLHFLNFMFALQLRGCSFDFPTAPYLSTIRPNIRAEGGKMLKIVKWLYLSFLWGTKFVVKFGGV